MAALVPSLETIDHLPKALEPGERALMELLVEILDDSWTVYVQPYLNGLQPDIIIFSEQGGIGIFEVKDWNLDHYRVGINGAWSVYDAKQERWHENRKRCPLTQVKHYRDSIIRYELPEIDAEIALDSRYNALIGTFVYFHNHTTKQAMVKIAPLVAAGSPQEKLLRHVVVFGRDWLNADMICRLLRQQRLGKDSPFAEFLQQYRLGERLRNVMSYPQHGRLDVLDILFDLHRDQKPLLLNTPGKKRVIGSAGSGKSLILARKAITAAESGHSVLVICFNITMVNYLTDVVRRLARHQSPVGVDLGCRILVRHYHRLFPYDGELSDPEVQALVPFDVLLVDEAQDFSRERLLRLYELARGNEAHVMLMEDDRQNIYGVDTELRRTVPGVKGRPFLLKRSFRLGHDIVAIANRLIELSQRQFESGEVESAKVRQTGLFRPVWTDGTAEGLLLALTTEVQRLMNGSDLSSPADIVVLVCSRYDGWLVCDHLDKYNLPYVCNFESREEHQRVCKLYKGEERERRINQLNRARKLAFRMQSGRIKVCTIHSFKGWELRQVLLFFNPNDKQLSDRVPLLYTAMTRAQELLAVFNAERTLAVFGQLASQDGLLTLRSTEPDPNAGA